MSNFVLVHGAWHGAWCWRRLIDAIGPRVSDEKFWDGHWLPNSRVIELKTGHDPMISAPLELTQILLDCAR